MKRGPGGFTLVEVLLACFIGMLIVVVITGLYIQVSRDAGRIQRYSKLDAQGRYGINKMVNDFRNFYRRSDTGTGRLEGSRITTDTAGQDMNSRVVFTIVDDPQVSTKGGQGEIFEVEYTLQKPEGFLLRRTRSQNTDMQETILARGISGLQIEYYDGQTWQPEWSGAGPAERVRITLSLATGRQEDDVMVLSREVSLRLAEAAKRPWEGSGL